MDNNIDQNSKPQLDETPPEYDVLKLASSAKVAFGVLIPWYHHEKTLHDKALLVCVTSRVNQYVNALNNSIKAAECGFTIAENAIAYVEVLRTGHQYAAAERTAFVRCIHDYANQGYTKAKAAEKDFRGVRIDLTQAIEDTKVCLDSKGVTLDESTNLKLKKLEDGIEVLVKFETSVQLYIRWWTWISHRSSAVGETSFIPLDLNAITRDTGLRMWTKLQDSYCSYTDTVCKQSSHCIHILTIHQISGITDVFLVISCDEHNTPDEERGPTSLLQWALGTVGGRLVGNGEGQVGSSA
ncbi:hypothetical protein BJ165DRAFT_1613558 [Panaeolus papilionaceus]|nr:hypothetical protein BJ165DRAFT_1613558 [Panaeolus papilionaceus]